ncbi:MAG: thermonuclease family protein [Paraglaciecola sp.]|nr:thermonuclease family protein [Paraglaciecola sp.]NCT49548.1 thermonuclease family protein [Paraglaciecola sp.]
MKLITISTGCFFAVGLAACSPANLGAGDVVKIVDGDSVILKSHPEKAFDLAYIDAPEREQPFGREAMRKLTDICHNPNVTFSITADNKLEVYLNGRFVNEQLVSEGMAWMLPSIPDPILNLRFDEAQRSAMSAQIGLWQLGHGLMIAPWQWRQQATQQIPTMHLRPLSQKIANHKDDQTQHNPKSYSK